MSNMLEVLLHWYEAVRNDAINEWPVAVYYLMGANEWRTASGWPPPEAQNVTLHLNTSGALTLTSAPANTSPDIYAFDPKDPTLTVGGSIVSYIYTPGSVDVAEVQKRSDVLTYTTAPLDRDMDVVGPIRLILFASSSAIDTDFSARLSDVFPDGRAIQLQNGMLRARYRDDASHPRLLVPHRVYRLEIDMWATANRFRTGHRLRLDICSSDFPRFDRNSNLGGAPGVPTPAQQTIYHDDTRPSHLVLSVLPS
jgi:putative CocE/NonD family hydrolase